VEERRVKVLLIEDNPGDTRLIREMLAEARGAAFDVECADRLSTGLDRLAAGDIAVVLLDLSLPDSLGLDTFTKAHAQEPHVAIIVLTSLDDEALAVEAVRGGAQDYLVKGQVDGDLLARAMRYAMERKRGEERLEELYERERELRQELETEVGRRADFTRALVHELKTPLTAVLASSDLLITELKEEPWLSLARNINRGASNLNSRIDELLDLARGEIGMLHPTFQSVDPAHLLQDIVTDMAPLASSHGQSLVLDLPLSLPTIRADAGRLRQVVLNLLGNAINFTSEGGKITLRTREEATTLVVEVEDTGPGIAEKEQEHLFERYYRLQTDRERLSGLGLGLALSKMLVELHGGQIWVKSQKGKGSIFGFSVPLEAAGDGIRSSRTGGNQ
jgi:signal transduction histidine kinase